MTNCTDQRLGRLMLDWVDGLLEDSGRDEVAGHVLECVHCQHLVAEDQLQWDRLRAERSTRKGESHGEPSQRRTVACAQLDHLLGAQAADFLEGLYAPLGPLATLDSVFSIEVGERSGVVQQTLKGMRIDIADSPAQDGEISWAPSRNGPWARFNWDSDRNNWSYEWSLDHPWTESARKTMDVWIRVTRTVE